MKPHLNSRPTARTRHGGAAYKGVQQPRGRKRYGYRHYSQRVNIGLCPVCGEWYTFRKDGLIRAHRVGSTMKESWPCPGSGAEESDQNVGKEMRELLAELKDLNFTWDITSQNHVKAKAPNGELFVFSVGGKPRSVENQRALLNKWKRDNLKPADPEEELAKLAQEEKEEPQISPLVVKAIEAMVYVIQSETVSTAEVDDLRAEVELLREENGRLVKVHDEMTRLAETLSQRITYLEGVEQKFLKLKKAFE